MGTARQKKLKVAAPPVDEPAPLTSHLEDLRNLIIKSLVSLAVALVVTYNQGEHLLRFLQRPLLRYFPADQQFLYFTGIADKFVVHLQVAAVAALFLTIPYQLYLVWSFVSPGLYAHEKKYGVPFLVGGTLSFVAGLAFGYYVVLPLGYEFLIGFGDPTAQRPMITMTEYFPLTLKMLGVVGLVFELPVVLMFLGALGVVTSAKLSHFRRHAYLGLTIAAAVLTPSPDAVSMLVVAIPLCLLYEVSVWGVKWIAPKRK